MLYNQTLQEYKAPQVTTAKLHLVVRDESAVATELVKANCQVKELSLASSSCKMLLSKSVRLRKAIACSRPFSCAQYAGKVCGDHPALLPNSIANTPHSQQHRSQDVYQLSSMTLSMARSSMS